MLRLFVFLLSFALLSAKAQISTEVGPDEIRIRREAAGFEEFLRGGQELTGRQFFQFSLKDPVRAAELDTYSTTYQMRVKSASLCSSKGVMGVPFSPDETIAAQASKVTPNPLMLSSPEEIRSQPDSESDLVPGDLRFCGFIATMSRSDVARFAQDIKHRIISVEFSDGRRIYVPINRWKIYGRCSSCL